MTNNNHNLVSNINDSINESILLNSQQILEHNEDIISVILENFQLGRYNDCLHYYSLLHNNLINIITELDNYPSGYLDISQAIQNFSDNIMRKDVLDDIKPFDERVLPQSVLTPPCLDCFINKISDYECRVTNKHIEPNYQFASHEIDEYIRAATVLSYNHDQHIHSVDKPKRSYRRWAPSEIHTVLIAISVLGKDYDKISKLLIDRTPTMIRMFITKNFSNDIIDEVIKGRLPPPPNGFYMPIELSNLLTQLKQNQVPVSKANNLIYDSIPPGKTGINSLTEAVTQLYKSDVFNLSNQVELNNDISQTRTNNSKFLLPSLTSLPALTVPPPIQPPNTLNDPMRYLLYNNQLTQSNFIVNNTNNNKLLINKPKRKRKIQKSDSVITNTYNSDIQIDANSNINGQVIGNSSNIKTVKSNYKRNRDGPYSISGRTKKTVDNNHMNIDNTSMILVPIHQPNSYMNNQIALTNQINSDINSNIDNGVYKNNNRLIDNNSDNHNSIVNSNDNARKRIKISNEIIDIQEVKEFTNEIIPTENSHIDIHYNNINDESYSILDGNHDITLIAGLVNENSFMGFDHNV